MGHLPWRQAWRQALYGEDGFYRRPEGPAGHFRTAVHAAPDVLAVATHRLAAAAGCTTVVDVGAGRGELLTAMSRAERGGEPLHLLGVDVVPRPPGLPGHVGWSRDLPAEMADTLLVGWELLDVVPCDVAEADGSGRLRLVEVDTAGRERLGAPVRGPALAWCERWWPGPWEPGHRVEVGSSRDEAWADATSRLGSGLAVAVDYDHDRSARPPDGTLTGYRAGRQVQPVPDGTTDITAGVALDAVASALADRHGPGTTAVVRQHEAMSRLGVDRQRPSPGSASSDPVGYLRALSRAGDAAALLDPGGLGGFGWLLLARGPSAAALVRSWADGRLSG